MFQQVLGQFDANASGGKVSKEALAQLIDASATAPQTDPSTSAPTSGKSSETIEAKLAEAKDQVATQLLPALGVGDKNAYSANDMKMISSGLEKILPKDVKGAIPALQAGLGDLVSQSKGQDVDKAVVVDFIARALMAQAKPKKDE